jgi:hypothetical protein
MAGKTTKRCGRGKGPIEELPSPYCRVTTTSRTGTSPGPACGHPGHTAD